MIVYQFVVLRTLTTGLLFISGSIFSIAPLILLIALIYFSHHGSTRHAAPW